MPLLLLCLFLGLDHCRPLVQEGSKQLLVNMLRVICPRIDLLRLLSLQLEINSQWLAHAMAAYASHGTQFWLTLDGGPSVVRSFKPIVIGSSINQWDKPVVLVTQNCLSIG